MIEGIETNQVICPKNSSNDGAKRRRDLEKEPFTEQELKLRKKTGEEARKLVEEKSVSGLGATSLTVAVEEDFILYMQLGDGDILKGSSAGEVTKPLSEDPRLLANETTSLVCRKLKRIFAFSVQKISADDLRQ